jgi:hypothetical protein
LNWVGTIGGAHRNDAGTGESESSVVLSKFGKLEAGGSGLFGAFKAALEAQIPLLTSVSPAFEKQWEQFAGRSYVVLPADLDRISVWRQSIAKAPGGAVEAAH